MAHSVEKLHPVQASSIQLVRTNPPVDATSFLQRVRLLYGLDLLLVLAVSIGICFYRLEVPSLGPGDEQVHSRAVLSMWHSGEWFYPKLGEKPYLNKPPFKMCLSILPVSVFGPSNFSLRFIDALCGVGTALILYLFGVAAFRSRLVGLLSPVLLLGCESYVFGHGVRMAVQDSMLVFLSTLAIVLGWFALFRSTSKQMRYACLAGLCVSFAVLTKNIAGFITLPILLLTIVLAGDFARYFPTRFKTLLFLIPCSFALPVLYFGSLFLRVEGAFEIAVGEQVVNRVAQGFHHSDDYWFYLNRIVVDEAAVPPVLLGLGLIYVFCSSLLTRRVEFLLLLTWAVIPVGLYSLVPSRLGWYIAPAYPAFALIGAVFLEACFHPVRTAVISWRKGGVRPSLFGFLSLMFFIYGLVLAGSHVSAVAEKIVLMPDKRTQIDRTVQSILSYLDRRSEQPQVLTYKPRVTNWLGSDYGSMLRPVAKGIGKEAKFAKELREGDYPFAIVSTGSLQEVKKIRPFTAYRFALPTVGEKGWYAFLFYEDGLPPDGFTSVLQEFDFGSRSLEVLYGLEHPGEFGETAVRWARGSEAAFLFEGDVALYRFGGQLSLRLLLPDFVSKEALQVEVFINGTNLGSELLRPGTFQELSYSFEPFVMRGKKNVIRVRHIQSDGSAVKDSKRVMFYDRFQVKLG